MPGSLPVRIIWVVIGKNEWHDLEVCNSEWVLRFLLNDCCFTVLEDGDIYVSVSKERLGLQLALLKGDQHTTWLLANRNHQNWNKNWQMIFKLKIKYFVLSDLHSDFLLEYLIYGMHFHVLETKSSLIRLYLLHGDIYLLR